MFKRNIKAQIKMNGLFFVSGCALAALNALTLPRLIFGGLGAIVLFLLTICLNDTWKYARQHTSVVSSALSVVVLWAFGGHFYVNMINSSKLVALSDRTGVQVESIVFLLTVVFAILAFYFVNLIVCILLPDCLNICKIADIMKYGSKTQNADLHSEFGEYICEGFKKSRRIKVTFLSALLFGIITHAFAFVNVLQNHDNAAMTPVGLGTGITSGRWGLDIVRYVLDVLFGEIYNIPMINGILAILILAVCACLVVLVYDIQTDMGCIFISAIMLCFPAITSMMYFMYAAPLYSFTILLSVLAVLLAKSTSRVLPSSIYSVLCITFALSIYQAYFPLTAAMLVLLLIQRLIRKEATWKESLRNGFRYFLLLIVGLVLYYAILQILLQYEGVTLNSYKGINQMGNINLSELPLIIRDIYHNCLGLMWEDYCSLSSVPILRFGIIVIYISSAVIILTAIFQKGRKAADRLMLLLLTIALPIAMDAIEIMCPDGKIYTLMVCAMIGVYFLAVLLWESVSQNALQMLPMPSLVLKKFLPLGMVIVIFAYIWSANGSYIMEYYSTEQAKNYLNRLVLRIESTSGYDDELPIAFIGSKFSDEHLSNQWKGSVFQFGGVKATLINEYSRNQFMRSYLGYRYTSASEEEIDALEQSEEVRNMTCYPDDGSIAIIDDIIVVKLQNTD